LYDNYEVLIDAQERNNNVIGKLQDVIRHLPKGNRATLQFLISFLHTLQQYSQTNKMTTDNLAIIFSPSLLCAPYELKDTFVMLKHSTLTTDVISTLISNYHLLFERPPPEKPDDRLHQSMPIKSFQDGDCDDVLFQHQQRDRSEDDNKQENTDNNQEDQSDEQSTCSLKDAIATLLESASVENSSELLSSLLQH